MSDGIILGAIRRWHELNDTAWFERPAEKRDEIVESDAVRFVYGAVGRFLEEKQADALHDQIVNEINPDGQEW